MYNHLRLNTIIFILFLISDLKTCHTNCITPIIYRTVATNISFYLNGLYLKKKKNLIEKFIEILSSNRNGKSIRIIRTTLFYIIYSIKFKRGTFCGHFLDISSIPKAKPLETFRFVVFTPPEKSSLPFHARKKISRTREREIERERKRERERSAQTGSVSFIHHQNLCIH